MLWSQLYYLLVITFCVVESALLFVGDFCVVESALLFVGDYLLCCGVSFIICW